METLRAEALLCDGILLYCQQIGEPRYKLTQIIFLSLLKLKI